MVLPNLLEYLRQKGIGGLESANAPFVGALFATVEGGDVSGIFLGARTSAPGRRWSVWAVLRGCASGSRINFQRVALWSPAEQ